MPNSWVGHGRVRKEHWWSELDWSTQARLGWQLFTQYQPSPSLSSGCIFSCLLDTLILIFHGHLKFNLFRTYLISISLKLFHIFFLSWLIQCKPPPIFAQMKKGRQKGKRKEETQALSLILLKPRTSKVILNQFTHSPISPRDCQVCWHLLPTISGVSFLLVQAFVHYSPARLQWPLYL